MSPENNTDQLLHEIITNSPAASTAFGLYSPGKKGIPSLNKSDQLTKKIYIKRGITSW